MRSAFTKGVARSITHSLGRFLAIAIIAGLGTGFYAGLRMTAPDMKLAGDMYYDGTNLADLRVMSTLGFTDAEIEKLRAVEGVEGVSGAYETDVLATIEGTQYTIRIHSLDIEAAQASDTSDGTNAVSDDLDYINRPLLVEGEWPDEPGECVLSADAVTDGEVKLGDTVYVLEGTQDIDETLAYTEYTVVGFVRSSYYASISSMGTTSLGSGSIDECMYIAEEDFADDLPYTQAFVTVEGAKDLFSSDEAYDEAVAVVAERIEELGPQINATRLDAVKAEAQEELDEAWAQYDAERADALEQLDDAQTELDDAQAQLEEAATQIAEGEAELDEGQAQLEESAAELARAREQLASSAAQLADSEAELEEGQAQYDEGLAALEAQQAQVTAQLDAAQDEIDQARAALESRAQLQEQLDQVQAALDALDEQGEETSEDVQAQRAELEVTIAQLGGAISLIDEQLDGVSTESLDTAQAALDVQRAQAEEELAQAAAALEVSKAQLDSGWAQLAEGTQAYEQVLVQFQEGLAQYQSGQATIEESQATLEQARLDYAEGLASWEEGVAELAEQRAEAEDEFSQAEQELADAQAQIDEIADPSWYVLDRSKIVGVASFESDANRIDQIARVFPFIFFLVAALVSLTTMTRMVEEERVLIGTFKALGYAKGRIISKYLVYALVASGVGSLIGIAILSLFLPYLIMEAYAVVYVVPPRPTPLDPGLALLSAGLGIGITLVATYFAAAATLRETPAALMLPRTPKAGKRILLERITPLWRRLSFSWKVTARNLFRYKRRFFMAVVGIAGCTALLLTGLGLQNAINGIIDKQFGEIYHYTMTVRMDEDASEDDMAAVLAVLEDTERIEDFAFMATDNMLARSDTQEEEDDQRFELVVPQDASGLQEFVTLRERVGHETLELGDEGVVLSEKLATELNVEEGDIIHLYEEDTVGNASGEGFEVVVSGIMENYVSQYIFMTAELYEQVFGETPVFVTIYAQAIEDEDVREQINEELLGIDGVSTVGFNDETISSYRTMLQSVDAVVVVLIVAAAVLAFVVLYNLTNINITERAREIATLKVLGFTPHEVNAYIYRETLLLSAIGALVGMGLGIWMESFVVVTAEVDQVMFGRDIHATSFLIAFVLTMAFSVIVTIAMRSKLARIDMVESLKSVE